MKAPAACRVLVVEDNLDTVQTFARLLKSEKHTVEFAINGYAAVDIAKKLRPNVIAVTAYS